MEEMKQREIKKFKEEMGKVKAKGHNEACNDVEFVPETPKD